MSERRETRYPFPPDDSRFIGRLGQEALSFLGIDGDRETHFIRTRSGRQIATEVDGDPSGTPVVSLHGTNGSRQRPKPERLILKHLGVKLITIDRPGYGYSDPNPGRRPIDTVCDIQTVLGYLGIREGLSVVGRSAGGPHALACAARLPGIERAAALVSMAPSALIGEKGYEGMGKLNSKGRQRSKQEGIAFRDDMTRLIQVDPRVWLDYIRQDDLVVDKWLEDHPDHEAEILQSWSEGMQFGPEGWHDDSLGNEDWGFDPRQIHIPTLIWNAGHDTYSPRANGNWLASNISTAQEVRVPEANHFSASFEAFPAVLGWCATGEYDPSVPVYV